MQTNMLLRVPQGSGLEMLVRYSEANDIPVVIGCDTISHHVAWDSTDTNCRGAALLEYIANSNLEIVNCGV
jgi:DNA-binding GntR family transcriptional regulator